MRLDNLNLTDLLYWLTIMSVNTTDNVTTFDEKVLRSNDRIPQLKPATNG